VRLTALQLWLIDDSFSIVQMRVVGDEACAPELRPVALEGIAGKHSRSISGWVKQQVVKLACSFTIQVRLSK
jgi:hypothetical protein